MQTKNVALIDDDASQRVVLKGFLEDMGYTVVAEGKTGPEAVEICRTLAPDLVIMDIGIPLKDGIEASSEILCTRPTPVVLVTGSDDADKVRRAVDAGVMAYLVKPIREEELFAAVELAATRFAEFKKLRDENVELKNAIEARKVIEKAKGLLMAKEGLAEKDAFARIRKISMDKRKTMKEIAEVLILALEGK